MIIKRRTLRKSSQENLLRLAKFLKLRVVSMSHKQIASLIYWRITRGIYNRY